MNDGLLSEDLTRPPLRYHGAKWRIAPWIIDHFPEHAVYVEPFGGAAGVLLRKPQSPVEVYNDIYDEVVNFWQVLRDPKKSLELQQQILLTPFSRTEFDKSHDPGGSDVERARKLMVKSYFGFGSSSGQNGKSRNGFRVSKSERKNYAREWDSLGRSNTIIHAANRFKEVVIENLDFRKLIPKYDSTETLFYVDSPYMNSTRDCAGKGYVHEMSDYEHQQLAWLLKNIQGKAILSAYPSRLYTALYRQWNWSSKEVIANGSKGGVKRTELLIKNF